MRKARLVSRELEERRAALETFDAAQRHFIIGAFYSDERIPGEALKNFEQAREIFHRDNVRSDIAASLLDATGLVLSDLGRKQEALEAFEEARGIWHKLGERQREAASIFQIGGLLADRGDQQAALRNYQQALELQLSETEALDHFGVALIHDHVGRVYFDLGEYQKALGKYLEAERSYDLAEEESERESGRAALLNNRGAVFAALGDETKALSFFNDALKIYEQQKESRGTANSLTYIGYVYSEQGNPRKALSFFNRALKYRQSAGDYEGEAYTLRNIGRHLAAAGRRAAAEGVLCNALGGSRFTQRRVLEILTLNDLGELYDSRGDRASALNAFESALSIAKDLDNPSVRGRASHHLMNHWKTAGHPSLAIIHGKQAVNSYQEIRLNISGLDPDLQRNFLESREETYRILADLLISEGRLPEAERVLEMLKKEEFFESMRGGGAELATPLRKRSDLSPDEKRALEKYGELADSLTALGESYAALEAERLALRGQPFSRQAELDEIKRQLDDAESVFQVYLRSLEQEIIGPTLEEAKADLQADLKRWKIPGAVVILTIVGKDRLHLILTTPNTRVPHTVNVTRAEINALVAEFRDAVKDRNIDPRPAGQKLYEIMFKQSGIEKDLQDLDVQTLVWSLDGALRYAPVAALSPDGEHYLAERYNNVIITLASRTKIGETPLPVKDWRVLGVGVSLSRRVGGEDFDPLPAVPAELEGIVRQPSQLCEGATVVEAGVLEGCRLLDSAFNQQALARARGFYNVMHVASHFNFVAGRETDSFLVTGEETPLTMERVMREKTFSGLQLLALSACETAYGGRASNGRELESLGKIAQDQGALSVLATLWKVADPSTRDLMVTFYRNYSSGPGMTKAQALRLAQLSLLGRDAVTEFEVSAQRDARRETPVDQPCKPRFKLDRGRRIPLALDCSPPGKKRFAFNPAKPYAHPFFWAPFVLIGNWR